MKTIAIKALAAASLSLIAVAPAAAEEVHATVHYGDLDISSAAGAEVLAQRVEAGVEAACGKLESRDMKITAAWQACKDTARADAVAQLAQKGTNLALLD